MNGHTHAHGGLCQLCNAYSQLLTSYGARDLCSACWSEQLQEQEPERHASIRDFARHQIRGIVSDRP